MKKFFSYANFCVFFALLFTSCVTTGFKDFYEPWYEDNYFPAEAYLKENEIPEVIKVSDLDTKFREISSNWYWCIGYSGFNGAELSSSEINEALTNLCKEKKAKLAIYSKEYTDTRNGVYSVPHTNYHTYTNSYGFTSSYTTTSYSSHFYSVERYDISSYLFVSIPDEYKILYIPGISVANLNQQDRENYKTNIGCLINIVYKDTQAYYANLVHGDVITKINEKTIYSVDDYFEYTKNAKFGDVWNMTIIRNGSEKQVLLKYALY